MYVYMHLYNLTQNCLCTIVLCFYSNFQLVIERGKSERSLRRMDKTKFLVPEEITISQLLAILRYRGHCNIVLASPFSFTSLTS